jgi:phage baseplate assembly protein W
MKTISLPFRFDGYGRVATTSDMSKIWADRVRSVISTALGERIMRPNFGTPTPLWLFHSTEAIESVLDVDVASAFATWLPALKYQGLTYTPVDDTGEVQIDVLYATPERATALDAVTIVIEVD